MVTGSSYFLSSNQTGILVDLGMFQGKPEETELNFVKPGIEFGRLSGVVVTHAHLDHCGRLPMLVGFGFKGPIFMTEATKALAEVVLFDAAKIAREDKLKKVIYTDEDVFEVLKQVVLVEYGKPFMVGEFEVTMVDAGHILGSASVVIKEVSTERRVVFSGDLGNSPEPLISPTEWVSRAEIAVVESTYGDEVHQQRSEVERLAEIVKQAEEERGTVLIPSFSIERSQELLYIFDQLKKQGRIRDTVPVFLDSPMAIRATEVFRNFPQLYSERLKAQVKTDDPFDFPNLILCDTLEKSKQIKNLKGVKVVIAGSGMMTGGRIIHHAINFLGDTKTQLVFVGYQAEGTMGREILDGKKELSIWGKTVKIRAQIKKIETMSSHADQDQLLGWLKKIDGLSKVFLVHGEELPRLVLAEKIKQEILGTEILLPVLNQEVTLDR